VACVRAHLFVLTGAGLSADSGLPTFRDAGGLWEGRRPEDVATPEAWAAQRELVWRFCQERRAALARVAPNAAHRALAQLERRLLARGCGFTLVTQNVDDLHERAGSSPLHMHGELAWLRCEACGARLRDLERTDPAHALPCADCGHAALRPDVVWFGELPFHLERIERDLRAATHVLAVGTSGQVWPAAGFLSAARDGGAAIWVQALERPANAERDDRFVPGRAAEVLPGLLAELEAELEAVGARQAESP
jgi:NAD-dependent deacetylase